MLNAVRHSWVCCTRVSSRVSNRGGLARSVVVLSLVLVLSACTSLVRNPVPEYAVDRADVPDIPGMRMIRDQFPDDWDQRLAQTEAQIRAANPDGSTGPASFLAISGGGANGAFGAGIIVGWSAAGDRPDFRLVTGVSTGALMAPFAFVGPEYDPQLRELYTTVSSKDIFRKRSLISLLSADAVADSAPLQELIDSYVDQTLLDAVAREHNKGRRLFIGTTHLDAGEPVLWNIGLIAASGHPGALALVRKVMLASASIPGLFPPVYIEVEVDGVIYDEMHVDGGATTQVFMYPESLDFSELWERLGMVGQQRMYVIRNARVDPEWKEVRPRFTSIASRSISLVIKAQGVGDLHRIYLAAKRDGIDYNIAYVPRYFGEEPEEEFDPGYMKKLFDLGYYLAESGYPWAKSPPGFEPR